MGWEVKARGRREGYYYLSVRTSEGIKKAYYGRGAAGQEAAAATELRREDRRRAKAAVQAERDATAEADRLAEELRDWTAALMTAWLVLTGHHCHRGCWRLKNG
jgi:hypothetical protein